MTIGHLLSAAETLTHSRIMNPTAARNIIGELITTLEVLRDRNEELKDRNTMLHFQLEKERRHA